MKRINWTGLALLLMVAGCNTSKIITSWKAENTVPQKYSKILVLGLIREADRTIQENMYHDFCDWIWASAPEGGETAVLHLLLELTF